MSHTESPEAVLAGFTETLRREGLNKVGFAAGLSIRRNGSTLTAELATEPAIFAKVPGTVFPQPLVVGKFYDSSDNDDYSPEEYVTIREKALIYNPLTHAIEVVYDFGQENNREEYNITDGVSFFKLVENGNLRPYSPGE